MDSIKYNRKNILSSVERFLRLYNLYDDFEKQYIIGNIKAEDFPQLYSVEMVREVLDALRLIPSNHNIYEDYIHFINEIHDIKNKNILEVGGGVIPRLGERLSEYQESGSITVYDPRLYQEQDDCKLILKKKRVTTSTDVTDVDLIIGLMPCKGAEELIKLAIKNKKDFVVWLCEGGPHGDYFDFYQDEFEWRSSMITLAEEGIQKKGMGKLLVKTMPKYNNNYPIIYNQRN